MYKKGEQLQYKDDLNYLVSLKEGRHGDMTQKEWEEYNRKLHYMNDRYAYGELDKINFLRGMMKGYENEFNLRRENMRRLKELEDEEDRRRLIDVNALGLDEKEKELERKKRLYNDQMDDLDNFNRRRLANDLRKREEDEKAIKYDIPSNIEKLYLPINQMRDKLRNSNNRMYGRISKYNNIIGEPVDPDTFNAKNDAEYNKRIADQRAKKLWEEKYDPNIVNEALQKKKELEDETKIMRENNLNRQKLYKESLDNQNQIDKLNRLKHSGEDTRPQLLMPAYYYPNLPQPIYHKARDGLLASKEQEKFFGKDMNNFFRRDITSNTLMDYEGKSKYLGDSKLRHNPITCPVNDYYYNKYVNKLKKESEIVPSNAVVRSQILPREKLIERGQYIFHQ
jgi:hypothetical protein